MCVCVCAEIDFSVLKNDKFTVCSQFCSAISKLCNLAGTLHDNGELGVNSEKDVVRAALSSVFAFMFCFQIK